MPKKTQVDDRFIRMHPELFQKQIILAAIKSYQFYRKMKERLCPYEESRQSRRPDFQGLECTKHAARAPFPEWGAGRKALLRTNQDGAETVWRSK